MPLPSDELQQQVAAQIDTINHLKGSVNPWDRGMIELLVIAIMTFSLLISVIIALLIRDGKRDADVILRIFGLVLIVTLAVLLVVVGFGESQIASVVGLLGTCAGYLLGRKSTSRKPNE